MRGFTRLRDVFSEYHAAGAVTGAFMLRRGSLKHIHYVGTEPQLFDPRTGPWVARDLGADPDYAGPRRERDAALRAIVDPEAADARARCDQAARVEEVAGPDTILA